MIVDLDAERQRMLDEHLTRRGIRDTRVLAAMAAIPRERFVPASLRDEAYADKALPIDQQQTISQPLIVGLIAQALKLSANETVLEVGVGSGYMAAVLAKLANWVIGVEIVPELARSAERRIRELAIDHVDIHVADGRLGYPDEAPFDAIIVSAAAAAVPDALMAQLADSGRLIMPIGDPNEVQKLTLFARRGGGVVEHVLCPCRFVPLVGDGSLALGGADDFE